jgi:hypothetical protein
LTDSGVTEAVVIIKAAPQVGERHGETVCCAGIDVYGNWLRLYPVSFRHLDDRQKFGRWDRIKFKWRRPTDDPRPESRRVDQHTIDIVGQLKRADREKFLASSIVTSLQQQRQQGRSLALLKPIIKDFVAEKKTEAKIGEEIRRFDQIRSQGDLFAKQAIPYKPCPYIFKYQYLTDDGERLGSCQDWEIEATYFKWSKEYGEHEALDLMKQTFGETYPRKGMLLAMGTHSLYPETWLINGVVRLDDVRQGSLI